MDIILAYYWAIVFVLPLTNANFTDVCNETYTKTQDLQCFPCIPGYTKEDDCVTNQTRAQCTQCNEGTFQPHCLSANETGECRNCTLCVVYIQNCTIFQNAICGGRNKITEEESPVVSVTFVLGMTLLSIFLFLLLLMIVTIMCIRNIRSTCRKHADINADINEIKCDEATDRKILRGDNDQDDNKGGYDRDATALVSKLPSSSQDMDRPLRNKERTVGAVATIECLSTENDKKTNVRASVLDMDDDYSDKGLMNICIADESKVIKTKTESEEGGNKLGKKCKPVAVISPVQCSGVNKEDNRYEGLRLTEERLQFTGDSQNTPKDTTVKRNKNGSTDSETKLSLHENQNTDVIVKYGDNVTQTWKINWLHIFCQFAKLFPPTEWEMFGIHLLSNCQHVINVHNTVERIKLEARNEHSTGWIEYAYMKVFRKWNAIMGDAAENYEQIVKAVSSSIESKEVMDTVLSIKRDPPKVPSENKQTSKNPIPFQTCYALYDTETPSASCSAHFSSRQVQRIHSSRCCTSTGILSNSTALQSKPNCHAAMQTSFQFTETRFEQNNDDESQTRCKIQDKGKKRTKSQVQNKMKLINLENYARDNAKQNLLSEQIPIRKCDYNIYMEHVIELVMKECRVTKKVVLSITYRSFYEAEEVTTKQNEIMYVVYCGKPNLFLKKKVFEDLEIYGNIARTKLLAYLNAQKLEYDKSDADTFLFLSFNGKAAIGQSDVYRKHKEVSEIATIKQVKSLNELVSTASSEETNSSNGSKNQATSCTGSQSIEQLSDNPIDSNHPAENNENHANSLRHEGHGTSNKDYTNSQNRKKGLTVEVACQTVQYVGNNQDVGNKIKIQKSTDINKECVKVHDEKEQLKIEEDDEMKMICDSFFLTGEETFNIDNPDILPDILSSFADQDTSEK